MASGCAEQSRDDAAHARQGTSLRAGAVPARAELAEQLLVSVRGQPRLHGGQVVRAQRELRASESGRAARSFTAAGLRAVAAARPLHGEAGEALAFAGAEVEVLPARQRHELRSGAVLHVTGRAEIRARA